MSPCSLSYSLVTSSGAKPSRSMMFLHGVFGSGSNWRSFARRFVEAKPDWAAVLVDLRVHGASTECPPPHSIQAAANDLFSLDARLHAPVAGLFGHSFGGKVAMAHALQRRGGALETVWVIDSSPSARPDQRGSEIIVRVLEALESAPVILPSREAFVAHIVEHEISRDLAQWLAMNLRPDGNGYRLRLDLGAIRQLLADYWQTDLWRVLESPEGRMVVHVVVGNRSRVFDEGDRHRLAQSVESSRGLVRSHLLETGHWVHTEDPDGLLALLLAHS